MGEARRVRSIDPLALDPARLLKAARYRSDLTQEELAVRAGVADSSISAFEKGRRTPSLPMLVRLLVAAGWQLRIELEPVWEGVDAAIDELAALPPEERWGRLAVDLPALVRRLQWVPCVVQDAAAAFVHGAPVPVEVLEVAATRDEGLAAIYRMLVPPQALMLPHVDDEEWEWILPGAGRLRVRVVEQLPPAVRMLVDEVPVAVLALPEVVLGGGDTPVDRSVRMLERLRARLASGA